MDLTSYTATLRENLTTAASAGDEQTIRTAAVLSAALEPAARLTIMNALADLAAEVTAHLDDHVVDVRLDGRDVRIVVTDTGMPGPEEEPLPPPTSDGGDISRITVRLLEELKAKAERAASEQGLSLNSFIAQAVQGALAGKGRRPWNAGPTAGGSWSGDWQSWKRQGQGNERPGHGSSRIQGWVQG